MDIVFDKAQVSYDQRIALAPLSLRLTEKRIGVIGLNGSGKSTFARLINGLIRPSSGRVITNGHDTSTNAAEARAIVGYVFQNPANQIVLPLIKDDIALGLQSRRLSKADSDRAVSSALDRVSIPHLRDRRAHELSGGEVQLAALAAVLATAPDVIVMDEPTNQLDLKNRNLVEATIRTLDENVIVITHDLDLVSSFTRVLLFHEGRLAADGAADETIRHYKKLVA